MSSDPDSYLIIDDDDLLNFSLEDDNQPPSSYSNPTTQNSDDYASSFPEFAEEELEWLSNKDAFPALDDILSNPNNNTSSNSNSHSHSHSHSITSCCSNLQIPLNYPVRKRSNRRRRTHQFLWWNQVIEPQLPPSSLPAIGRRCRHCLAEKTPQWRAGPMGPKTLCNACGVRYKSGRLVAEYRPANSPSFSMVLHSNSHRKIMEMRKKMHGG